LRLGKRGLGVFTVVVALAALAGSAFASSTCMRFLRISSVPRIAALGEAGVAVEDATWAEANPAHLANLDGSLITFSHTAWFEDISLEAFSIGTASGRQGFGLSVAGLHTDPLESYSAFDEYQGTFRYFDFVFTGTYARSFASGVGVGVSGKTVYEKIDWDSATGFAIDIGLAYAVPGKMLGGRLALGGAVRNIGTDMGYFEEKFELPLTFKSGLSYRPGWLPEFVGALLALDYEKAQDEDGGILVGLEVQLADMIAVRGGRRGTYENGDITFGLGVSIARTLIDYSFVDMGTDLGDTHRVSLALRVGEIFPSPTASQ
jgi:hypothetical protein